MSRVRRATAFRALMISIWLTSAFLISTSAMFTFTMPAWAQTCRAGAQTLAKVELYLGVAGSPAAWQRFLSKVVTPRFPDGLTVHEGHGQWRGARGLVREPSHVLVVFYKPDATSEARIEAIRHLYMRRFKQQSVLRADSSACVAF